MSKPRLFTQKWGPQNHRLQLSQRTAGLASEPSYSAESPNDTGKLVLAECLPKGVVNLGQRKGFKWHRVNWHIGT